MKLFFKDVPIGTKFTFGSNTYIKTEECYYQENKEVMLMVNTCCLNDGKMYHIYDNQVVYSFSAVNEMDDNYIVSDGGQLQFNFDTIPMARRENFLP